MADKIFDDDDFQVISIRCKCLSPSHIADIDAEITDDGHIVSIGFTEYLGSHTQRFRDRIKMAIKILMGKKIWTHDFLFRKEDIGPVIDFLSQYRDIADSDTRIY